MDAREGEMAREQEAAHKWERERDTQEWDRHKERGWEKDKGCTKPEPIEIEDSDKEMGCVPLPQCGQPLFCLHPLRRGQLLQQV